MLLNMIQWGLSCIICRSVLCLIERNVWMMRIHYLRLHVLLLYLMKGLLKKIGTFITKWIERVLRSKLSLLLLVSCFLRTDLSSLWLYYLPINTSLWPDQVITLILIIIHILPGSQSLPICSSICESRRPAWTWGTSLISNLLSRHYNLLLSLRDNHIVLAVIHLFLLVKLVIFVVVVERMSRGAVLVITLLVHMCVYLKIKGGIHLGRLEFRLVKEFF